MISRSLCLADAHVLIDGARFGFLMPLLRTHTIGVASMAHVEVRFFRDENGEMHPIDLEPFVTRGDLAVLDATGLEMQALYERGVSARLGSGELESLGLVLSRGLRFCTADRLAVKTMANLGLYERWIPLEDLLATLDPPQDAPDPKYLRATIGLN